MLNLFIQPVCFIKIKNNDGIENKIKDINEFSKYILHFHSNGISLRQENRYNITLDVFWKKSSKIQKIKN